MTDTDITRPKCGAEIAITGPIEIFDHNPR